MVRKYHHLLFFAFVCQVPVSLLYQFHSIPCNQYKENSEHFLFGEVSTDRAELE